MSETPMNKLRALCEKWEQDANTLTREGRSGDATMAGCAYELRAILRDVERLPCPICGKELSSGISWCKTCDTTHAVRSVECHPCGYISTGPCELGKKDAAMMPSPYDWHDASKYLPKEGEFVRVYQLWGWVTRYKGGWAAVDECGNKCPLIWEPKFWRREYQPQPPVAPKETK